MGKDLKKSTIVKLIEITKKAAGILEGAAKIEKRKLKNYMEKVLEEKAIELEFRDSEKIKGR